LFVGGQTAVPPRTFGADVTSDVRSDRCILQSEFAAIEALLPHKFTFDACCNDSGDNAMCALFASPSHSFLDTDVSGHNVWLNPPFAKIAMFVRHYLACNARSPENTSACILIPAWKGKHRRLLQGMQLLRTYAQGHVLFTAPRQDGSRQVMQGIPWPVEVWYDPPGRVVNVQLQAARADQPLMFRFAARVAGCSATVLLDSGASHSFISAAFAEANGLKVLPPVQAYTVRLASGESVALQGQCTFKVTMQDYSGTVTALVMPEMLPQTDLILGDGWLRNEQAKLCYSTGTCTLHKGGRVRTLSLARGDLPVTDDQLIHHMLASMIAAVAPPPIISAKQAHKEMKRGARCFTVLVQEVLEDVSVSSCNTMMCAPKCVKSTLASVQTETNDALQSLLDEYKDVFADLPPGLPPERNVVHSIPLEPGSKPPAKRLYRLSPAELTEVKRQVKELLTKGFIEPSTGPFGAPILFVAKRDGSLRMVIDYRALNKITIKDMYPLPRIEDVHDSLQGATVFSTLDLQSGYHQLRIAPEDVPKTAFTTHVGTYQFKVLSMGLTNSPAVFSRAMNDIFKDCIGKYMVLYLDDLCIFSKSEAEHIQHLRSVLSILRKNRLFAKLKKCEFLKPSLKFLGHIVSADGLRVDPSKIAVMAGIGHAPRRTRSCVRS
jgi:hypothetical protein